MSASGFCSAAVRYILIQANLKSSDIKSTYADYDYLLRYFFAVFFHCFDRFYRSNVPMETFSPVRYFTLLQAYAFIFFFLNKYQIPSICDTLNSNQSQDFSRRFYIMKVTIAIDSLKGSLSSLEAGHAIESGVKRVYPDADVCVRPLADGGEGTVEALTIGMGGTLETITVTGPHGRPVSCQYGIINDTKTAIMEMAAAAGITLVNGEERNPLKTTTYGVGEMILDAIKKGCRRFIVGIGGSATNDGGVGMLQALGYDFMDADGNAIPFGAGGLEKLASISAEHVVPELTECTFKIACDVTNPLCGPLGASAIYGPQKGATPDMVRDMDSWLGNYAKLAKAVNPAVNAEIPGTGAAGGLGFAFSVFTNAVLESGISIILEETKLEDYVKDADIVITGEGRLDGQTVMGKAPIGVAKIAKKFGKTVLAFSGCVTEDAVRCNEHGIDAFFPILRGVVSLEEAMDSENARQNMSATVEQAFRLIRTVKSC